MIDLQSCRAKQMMKNYRNLCLNLPSKYYLSAISPLIIYFGTLLYFQFDVPFVILWLVGGWVGELFKLSVQSSQRSAFEVDSLRFR